MNAYENSESLRGIRKNHSRESVDSTELTLVESSVEKEMLL